MKGQLDLMRRACGELEDCDDFVTLLQEVLKTGNRLNEGTMRGSAAGAQITMRAHLLGDVERHVYRQLQHVAAA